MSELTRLFLNAILIENPVFMTFVGALLAVVEPRSARSSYAPAVRYASVFTAVGLFGGALAGVVPDGALPVVLIAGAALGIAALRAWGQLTGSWQGMPAWVLALAPLVGLQLVAAAAGDLSTVVAVATGNGLGFAAAYVVIGSIREHSRISEAPEFFKTNPVILFSMAMFALVLSGFLFL